MDKFMNSRILFLTTASEDYLQDTAFYGLRKILGNRCVDYPRKDVMYSSCKRPSSQIYGNGFTVWKLLPEVDVDRSEISEKILQKYFDLIIFGSAGQQQSLFCDYATVVLRSRTKCVFLDGKDSGGWRTKQLLGLFIPYYKRERIRFGRLFTRNISFSIPQEKIRTQLVPKNQRFARHVQCDEAYKISWVQQNCQRSYAFADEEEYRADLARSYYAITMKKGGWDCMRHYEIAANGAVMAFYNLQAKPEGCAPHGLIDMENVVAFGSADELIEKMQFIERDRVFQEIQHASMRWALEHSSEKVASKLLNY